MYYLLENLISKDSNSININQDDNNLNIYINNKDDYIKNKLISYLDKKRVDKKVNKHLNSFK